MNLIKFISFIIGILLIAGTAYSQSLSDLGKVDRSPKGSMWIKMDKEKRVGVQDWFRTYQKHFGLQEHDKMVLKRTDEIKDGRKHYRYQQIYCDLIVEGAQLMLHEKAGKIERVNGFIITGLNLNTVPSVSEGLALNSALKALNAKSYRWEDPRAEEMIKRRQNNPNATFYPKGEVVITRKFGDLGCDAENFIVAYKFAIYTMEPFDGFYVYIDAHSGNFIKKEPAVLDCATGSANTLYDGPQNFPSLQTPHGYLLRCDNLWTKVSRLEKDSLDDYDNDNIWNDTRTKRAMASVQWAMEKTRDYYFNKQGWWGLAGNWGGEMLSFVIDEYSPEWVTNVNGQWPYRDNAGFDSHFEETFFTDGYEKANNFLTSLDIVGHEWTHDVTFRTSQLVYQYESGALNESFSDIFGTAIEHYAYEIGESNNPGNYQLGEDVWITDGYLRNMADPKAKTEVNVITIGDKTVLFPLKQPNTYYGESWYQGVMFDNGGVHTNSGVLNYWFYLLSHGGSGTNDFGYSYSVDGIGMDNAATIAFYALAYALTPYSDYYDAFQATIWGAEGLLDSTQLNQVYKAWRAVGVPAVDLVLDESNVTYNIDQYSVSTDRYRAINSITAGPLNLTPEFYWGNFSFGAGNLIRLKPGFVAKSDANLTFRAYIDPMLITDPANAAKISSQPNIEDQNTKQKTSDLEIPNSYSILQNYPNPFNPMTTIKYGLPEGAQVMLKVYDILGREVSVLVNEYQGAGYKSVNFNASNLPSGVYFYRLQAGNFSSVKKTLLLK